MDELKKGDLLLCIDADIHSGLELNRVYRALSNQITNPIIGLVIIVNEAEPRQRFAYRFKKVNENSLTKVQRIIYDLNITKKGRIT